MGVNGRLIDMIDFNLEYYRRTTTSMLMEVPYSYTTGFPELMANVGSLVNSGFDLTIGVDILRGKDYFLRASTTFNYNMEKVTALFNGKDRWEIPNTEPTETIPSFPIKPCGRKVFPSPPRKIPRFFI